MAKRPKTVMLTLRIPVTLRTALRSSAKGVRRSVNSFVVTVLEKSLQSDQAADSPSRDA